MYQGKRVRRATRMYAWIMIVLIGVIYSLTAVAIAVSLTEAEEEIPVVRAEEITTTLPTESPETIALNSMIEEEQKQKEEMFSEIAEASLIVYDAKPTNIEYTVESGDTLWRIANQFYNDGSFYPYLMETNELLSTNVREGQSLTIKFFDESEREAILSECYNKIEEMESVKKYNSSFSTTDNGIPANAELIGSFIVTGYDPYCSHCCGKTDGITASGKQATYGRTIAADKSRFPFGTKLYIEGLGTFTVEDRGGAIKNNKIDVAVPSHDDAYKITGNYNVYIVS